MKRIVALFLLVLFMMNMLGLYGVFLGVQYKYTQEVTQNLDNEKYAGEDVLTFKVPLTVPYYNDSREYERVHGDFELNGEVYQLVKQKLLKDTLYIVCVKDHKTKKIRQALTDYVKTFTDKPVDARHSNTKLFQNLIKDFLSISVSVERQTNGWEKPIPFSAMVSHYQHVSLPLNGPPPRA